MRIIVLTLLLISFELSAQVFVIQRGQEALAYDNIDDAFLNLESGDELYIPGGTYNLKDFFPSPCLNEKTLPDSIKIFGAGHYPEFTDITGKTFIQSNLGTCAGSSKNGILKLGFNNVVSGIEFDFHVKFQTNASISYCKFIFINVDNSDNVVNIDLRSSIIKLSSNFGKTGLIYKNIIEERVVTGNSNMVFDSNIFLDTTNYSFNPNNWELINGTNATFKNNIFLTKHTNATSLNLDPSLIFTNNLFVGSNPITGDIQPGTWAYEFVTNNTFFQDPNTMFENYNWGAPFDYNFDFHLIEGHVGIGADTNEENIGIYKTEDETENKIPFNPHFLSKTISTESTANGILNVTIEIEAREK